MTLHENERELDTLDKDVDEMAAFLASLGTSRLTLIGRLISYELALRNEGKPADKSKLH